jgi:hypothetical protein
VLVDNAGVDLIEVVDTSHVRTGSFGRFYPRTRNRIAGFVALRNMMSNRHAKPFVVGKGRLSMSLMTEHKIVAIETSVPEDHMPGLLLVRVHTDSGLVGHGETYYTPQAVAAMIHDWMARRLLGASALAIEAHAVSV